MSEKLIAGFLKCRNSILRNDLYNCLLNLENYIDDLFVCSDASYDGTTEILQEIVPEDQLLIVPPEKHSFAREMYHKQELMEMLHKRGPYSFIFWIDSDEILDDFGTHGLRQFCKDNLTSTIQAWSFHYTQFWRNTEYARTDEGFDDGHFIKLWRYRPDLEFEVGEGTHRIQFPKQVMLAYMEQKIHPAPFEILHYGNVGQTLKWKHIQYHRSLLGGLDRHLKFNNKSTYRKVDQNIIPEGAVKIPGGEPQPFTDDYIEKTIMLDNLTKLQEHFCVIISSYNRADTLPAALDSLLAQTYQKWHCIVADDGSVDSTEQVMQEYCDKDPRIFYAKYLDHKGGVAINELGMQMAIETAEYFVRLGSDDQLFPHSLETYKEAFRLGHQALYSPFVVKRGNVFGEIGNLPVPHKVIKEKFPQGGFFASWASFAVKCNVLQQVKDKYGNFVDPRLINMEDFLFNYRVSTLIPWIFVMKNNEGYTIDPDEQIMKDIHDKKIKIEPSGFWNCVTTGASGNTELYNKDQQMTLHIIAEEQIKYESIK